MARAPGSVADKLIQRLRSELPALIEEARSLGSSPQSRARLNVEIHKAARDLNELLIDLDPIKRPGVVFDPGNPSTVGFFVALAMAAQPRQPLKNLADFYGAGIYALYYKGRYKLYKPIAGTETPIYVGMAIQGAGSIHDPFRQGTPLSGRLAEHKKNIERATGTLSIADFEYRALVIQSGWESAAENYLIRLFRPIWNKETRLVYGIGKHGDDIKTRGNRRSPWDTLHSGRKWAVGEQQRDAKSLEKIAVELNEHFVNVPAFKTFESVFSAFISDLKQSN